jgi:hypothetical protein
MSAKDAQISRIWSEFFTLYVRLSVYMDISGGSDIGKLFAGTFYLYDFWKNVENTSYNIQLKSALLGCLGRSADTDVYSVLKEPIDSLSNDVDSDYELVEGFKDPDAASRFEADIELRYKPRIDSIRKWLASIERCWIVRFLRFVPIADAFNWQTAAFLSLFRSNRGIPNWVRVEASNFRPLQRALNIFDMEVAMKVSVRNQAKTVAQASAVQIDQKSNHTPIPSVSIFGIPVIPLSIAATAKSKPHAYQPMNMDIDMKSAGGVYINQPGDPHATVPYGQSRINHGYVFYPVSSHRHVHAVPIVYRRPANK